MDLTTHKELPPQHDLHDKVKALLERCGEICVSPEMPTPVTLGRKAAVATPTLWKYFLECKMISDDQKDDYDERTGGNGLRAVRVYCDIPDVLAARLQTSNFIPHLDDVPFDARARHVITSNQHFKVDINIDSKKIVARIDSSVTKTTVYLQNLGVPRPFVSRYDIA